MEGQELGGRCETYADSYPFATGRQRMLISKWHWKWSL